MSEKLAVGTRLKRNYCQFIPDPDGAAVVNRVDEKRKRVEIHYGGTNKFYWLLPDNTVSSRSIEPVKFYEWREGRYRPLTIKTPRLRTITFSISGAFPFFRVYETGDWVWLNADGTFTRDYVNFIEQLNEFQRAQIDVMEKYKAYLVVRLGIRKKRRTPRKPKIVLTHKITAERQGYGDVMYRWTVFGNGEIMDYGWIDEKDEAGRTVARVKSKILTEYENGTRREPLLPVEDRREPTPQLLAYVKTEIEHYNTLASHFKND